MDHWHTLDEVKQVSELRDAYGPEIELEGMAETYKILVEFQLSHASYAILQSKAMKKEDEIEVFRYVRNEEQFLLENVEDDNEWENIAEIYDEFMYNKLTKKNEAP